MADYEKLMKILIKNQDKSFVKRILDKESYPVLDIGDGNVATHKMAYGEIDTDDGKKYVVYPTVLYDGKKLVDYGDSAFNKVMETGNFIDFDTPEEAEWFSKNYKQVWDK